MNPSRYVIGIDLGTTNCALAYVDTEADDDSDVQHLAISQVVGQGEVDERSLLPSLISTISLFASALALSWWVPADGAFRLPKMPEYSSVTDWLARKPS